MVKYSCEVTPRGYTEFGGPLPVDSSYTIRWHLHNFSKDLDRWHQWAIIGNAFGEWERYTWPIRFQSTSEVELAQWHIYWVDGNKIRLPDNTSVESRFDFTKHTPTLAVQYASPDLVLLINDSKDYSANTPGSNTFDLYKTILHEIGHGLGLGHTNHRDGKNDIMLPVYDPKNKITINSIRGIYDIHGKVIKRAMKELPYIKLLHSDTQAMKSNPGCLPSLNFLMKKNR